MSASLQIGGGNWGTKDSELLGYKEYYSGDFIPKIGTVDRNCEATYTDKDGVIKTAQPNIARIDYSEEENGVLLLEPQSSNLITYSEDLTNWTNSGGSATSNLFTENTAEGTHNPISNSIAVTDGLDYSISFRVKYNGRQYVRVRCIGATDVGQYIDVLNGVTFGNPLANEVITITPLEDGYFKVLVTWTSTTTGNITLRFQLSETGLTSSYQGDGVSGIFFENIQLEQSSYPTSYIPTNGVAVTRLADKVTDFGDVNDFNSEEGVLYVEMSALSADGTNRYISISDGTLNNRVGIYYNTLDGIAGRVTIGGVTKYLEYQNAVQSDFHEIAIKWKLNDYALYIDSIEVVIDNTGVTYADNTLTTLELAQGDGANRMFSTTKTLKVYKSIVEAQVDLPYIQ